MDILKTLDKNTKILNISNCGLKGVLDLYEFENVEELYCSNNLIIEIKNLPNNIKYLDCSFNKISQWELSFYEYKNLEELYCNDNEINELKIPKKIKSVNSCNNEINNLSFEPNKKILKYPKNLTYLTLGDEYNEQQSRAAPGARECCTLGDH